MSTGNAPVNPGDVLAGKYRVEKTLGQGNMGVVVTATHIELGQRVALKFLLPQRVTSPAVRERFLREARAAACLKSQHVTRVSDVGTLDTGAPYMVMEFLEGCDLAAVLDEHGPLPITDAVECILQVCEAVGEAHRAGIVHRDLKPANLFLTRNSDGSPHVKVLDFGVSKVSGGGHLKLTAQGQFVGSPLYMSPEQMQAKDDVDARSDIWALGVILYELVAGKTPFDADNLMVLQTKVFLKPPEPLTTYLPDAPPSFEAIILQCLDKRPERRWQNVADFAAALVRFAPPRAATYAARVAGMCGVAVEPSRPTDVLPLEAAKLKASEPAGSVPFFAAGASTTGATSQSAGVPPKARTGWVIAGAGAALVAAVVGSVGIVHWSAGPAVPGPSSGVPGSTTAVVAVTADAAPPAAEAPSSDASVMPRVTPTEEAPATTAMPKATAAGSAMVAATAMPIHKSASLTRPPMPKDQPTARPTTPSGDPYGRGEKR